MSQVKPLAQYEFKGINLAGNPITRPAGSASLADNVKVMPGNWLRLKSGRVARVNLTNGRDVLRITSVRLRGGDSADDSHLVLARYEPPPALAWDLKMLKLDLATFTLDEAGLETVSGADDQHLCAQAQLSNSVVFSNGIGKVLSGVPTPSLTQWMPPTTIRYHGLSKPYFDGSTPPGLSFVSGPGNNKVNTEVRIYVGFHNVETQHYSNGYLVGIMPPSGGYGELSVTSLGSLVYATHGATETSELRFVFYATIDSLDVPYLMMNSTLDGPFTAPITDTTVNLSIAPATDNGWVLDRTKEMPIRNYPPRRMRSIAFAGGRLYGIPSDTSGQTAVDEYQILPSDQSSVVFTEADGSVKTADFLGDPIQSWPPQNVTSCPSGERPLALFTAPNSVEVIVWTANRTFLLREQADGIQEWTTISESHGLYYDGTASSSRTPRASFSEALIASTRHGICWMTQRCQIAIYRTTGEFEIISADYDSMFNVALDTFECATYLFDPKNLVDRLEIFWSQWNGSAHVARSTCHDFNTGAVTTTGPHFVRAAGTIKSRLTGKTFHVVAGTALGSIALQDVGLYSVEGQPDSGGRIPLRDQLFTGSSGSTASIAQIGDGYYIPNWNSFGDPNLYKEIRFIDLIGDASAAASLAAPAITLAWVQGFQAISTSSGTVLQPVKFGPMATDSYYRFKVQSPHHNFWKFILRIRAHAAAGDYGEPLYLYTLPAVEGDLAANFYGSVLCLLYTVGTSEQRP